MGRRNKKRSRRYALTDDQRKIVNVFVGQAQSAIHTLEQLRKDIEKADRRVRSEVTDPDREALYSAQLTLAAMEIRYAMPRLIKVRWLLQWLKDEKLED